MIKQSILKNLIKRRRIWSRKTIHMPSGLSTEVMFGSDNKPSVSRLRHNIIGMFDTHITIRTFVIVAEIILNLFSFRDFPGPVRSLLATHGLRDTDGGRVQGEAHQTRGQSHCSCQGASQGKYLRWLNQEFLEELLCLVFRDCVMP